MARIEEIPECNAKDKNGNVFGWCSKHPVVHIEGENLFCMFHAPKGHKKNKLEDTEYISEEDFNKRVNRIISIAEMSNSMCILSGTVFENKFELHPDIKKKKLPDLNLREAKFQVADFRGAEFKVVDFVESEFESADFTTAKFSVASFRGAEFNLARFDLATFTQEVRFDRAKFYGLSSFYTANMGNAGFNGAHFRKTAEFSLSKFTYAGFPGVVMEDEANFNAAEINKADFTKAKFCFKADFESTVFSGNAVFNDAEFHDSASFKYSKFYKDVHFFMSRFDGPAYFNEVLLNGKSNFYGTIFEGGADFHKAVVMNASFREVVFRENENAIFNTLTVNESLDFISCNFSEAFADFRDMVIKGDVLFQRTKMHMAAFTNTDIRACKFHHCDWKEEGERYVLYDEKLLLENNDKYYKDNFDTKEESIMAVESLYRANKQRSGEMHNQFDYSKWHISEKEMQLRRLPNSIPKALLWFYKKLSGFGEQPTHALAWLLVFIYLTGVGIGILGIKKQKELGVEQSASERVVKVSFVKGFEFKQELEDIHVTTIYTLETLSFMKTPEYSPASYGARAWQFFFRLATTLQFTLFAFALRNRFRR